MKLIVFTFASFFLVAACGSEQKQELDDVENTQTTENLEPEEEKTSLETTDPEKTELVLTPLDNGGDLGQTTFTHDEKTIFYYSTKDKKGKIIINGKTYSLTNYKFTASTNSYLISGSGVTIHANDCKMEPNEGEDCFYGTFPEVHIKLKKDELVLNDVAIQDCPNY